MDGFDNLPAAMPPFYYIGDFYEYRVDGQYQLTDADAERMSDYSLYDRSLYGALHFLDSQAPTATVIGSSTWIAWPLSQSTNPDDEQQPRLTTNSQSDFQYPARLPGDDFSTQQQFHGLSNQFQLQDNSIHSFSENDTARAPFQSPQIDPRLDINSIVQFSDDNSTTGLLHAGLSNTVTPNGKPHAHARSQKMQFQPALDSDFLQTTTFSGNSGVFPRVSPFHAESTAGTDGSNYTDPSVSFGSTPNSFSPTGASISPSAVTNNTTQVTASSIVPGLTTTLHSFDEFGGARKWFHAGRRPVALIGGRKTLREFKENQLFWEGKLKTAIVTAVDLPANPTKQDLRNEKMRTDFVDLLEKKFGDDLAECDMIMSGVAGMIFEEFINLYEQGSRYFTHPRPSTQDKRDDQWSPKQRMELLIASLTEAKLLAGHVLGGLDKISELVAFPASSFDSVYTAGGSNEKRGMRTMAKKLEVEAAAARLAAGGSIDANFLKDNDDAAGKRKGKVAPEKKPSTKALERVMGFDNNEEPIPTITKKTRGPSKTQKVAKRAGQDQANGGTFSRARKALANQRSLFTSTADAEEADAYTGAEQESDIPTPISPVSRQFEGGYGSSFGAYTGNQSDYAFENMPKQKRSRYE